MKKQSPKKLRLNRETLTRMSNEELARIEGAGNTVWCTEQCSLVGCTFSTC